ncbi:Fic family protein [Limosilactobacillus avium]|uniref:Fic family protein n=1 Tax=Limosilactobacillus avium TaxID=2991831 RepID=UPI0024BB69B2|nr:Fic family protein [Limosilactobacillus avium]
MIALKTFNYKTLNDLRLTTSMVEKLSQIHELKGKTAHISIKSKDILDKLLAVAKIESTDSSNRIEGIATSDVRLKQLMNQKTMPKNRSEEEIYGYRDVLATIHENYQYIKITPNNILALHKELFNFTASTWGGEFKNIDNAIITTFADGHRETHFTPPPAYLTPKLIEELCNAYKNSLQENYFPPLIIAAAFMLDFVSIHPFRDGNGRMSRLLMLLELHQLGFDVGKYISLERLIEKTKAQYYNTLLKSSGKQWSENKNDYSYFIDYFLSIVLQAYRELDSRIDFTNDTDINPESLILAKLSNSLRPLSRRELMGLIPQYGETTIKHALATLRKQHKIKLIGRGRASKYKTND